MHPPPAVVCTRARIRSTGIQTSGFERGWLCLKCDVMSGSVMCFQSRGLHLRLLPAFSVRLLAVEKRPHPPTFYPACPPPPSKPHGAEAAQGARDFPQQGCRARGAFILSVLQDFPSGGVDLIRPLSVSSRSNSEDLSLFLIVSLTPVTSNYPVQ